jgi:ketol-acid reductoisomerase
LKEGYATHPIEKVGATLRAMMPWLKKKGMDRSAPAAKKPVSTH